MVRAHPIQALDNGEWDRVWEAYDRRQAVLAPPAATLPKRPNPAAQAPAGGRRRGRSMAGAVLLTLAPLLAALSWGSPPVLAALEVHAALMARDPAALAPHLDGERVRQAAGAALAAELQAAEAKVPGRAAGAFLDRMATGMQESWAQPSALAEVARARGTLAEAAPRLQPDALNRLSVPLAGPRPITLHLSPTEGGLVPRWQVTAVSLPVAVQRAAPAPLRLSVVR
jgi:hypothetical protein